jgi:hypothetical protein
LASLVMLSACTLAPAATRTPTKATGATRTASAQPTKAPAAKPSTRPTPSVPMAEITGQLRIDAAYVIANNAGTVIANNGGNVLQVGNGLISDNGLGVISNNGGGLAGSRYRVLAAPLSVGTLLPVAGMSVVAVSLLDGKPIGEPVTSDATGRFKVAVPKAMVGNTLVQARVPNSTDTRLQYDVVTKSQPAKEAVVAIDEDESAMGRFLRRVYAGKVEELILRGEETMEEGGSFNGTAEQNPIVASVLKGLIADMEAAKVKDLPDAERKALAQRVCDILLYYVDLDGAGMDRTYYTGPDEPAVGAMRDLLKQFREGATKKMTAEPAFFTTQPYVVRTNEALKAAGKPLFEVKKPADLNDYVVEHVLLVLVGNRTVLMREVAASIGMPESEVSRFNAASLGVLNTIGVTLVANSEAKKAMSEAIRAAAPKADAL